MHEEPALAKAVDELHPGCFVLAVEMPDGNVEALAMHKFEHALSTMVCRETATSLQMRYLTKEEREGATNILDAENKEELKQIIQEEKVWVATRM